MNSKLVIFFVATIVICNLSTSVVGSADSARRFVERDTRSHPDPQHWTHNGAVSSTDLKQTTMGFSIALKQSNRHLLEKLFWEVSDPSHENYGQYVSTDDITNLVQASQEAIDTVMGFLAQHGVEGELTHNRDFVNVKATGEQVQTLFNLPELHSFTSVHQGHISIVRSTHPYSLPEDVAQHVEYVNGITSFPRFRPSILTHEMNMALDAVDVTGTNEPTILRLRNGDTQLAMFVVVKCANGDYSNTTQQCMQTAAGAPKALRVNLKYNSSMQNGQVDSSYDMKLDTSDVSMCNTCDGWKQSGNKFFTEMCSGATTKLNIPTTAVFCGGAVTGLTNYVATEVSISTVFADNSVSAPYMTPRPVYTSPLVTPDSLRASYNIPQGQRGGVQGNSMAVVEFLDQWFNANDLAGFLKDNGMPPQPVDRIVGPNTDSQPGGEAQLDIEYIMGVAPGVETWFWSTGGLHDNQERFLTWLQNLAKETNPPLVNSVSYDDDEGSMTEQYRNSLDAEFMKLGARGISIFIAAGDDGACSIEARTNATQCNTIRPTYPATSHYVTAVGGTTFSTQSRTLCTMNDHGFDFKCNLVGEITSSSETGSGITTGGGFSNVYETAPYQKQFVDAYLANPDVPFPPANMWKTGKRGYPDISGVAHNYMVKLNNVTIQVDGTSASTPLVAAMVALLNDARLSTNQPPMGFINPWMYKMATTNPEAFYDVTQGNNRCTANPAICCPHGWYAAIGWDAATGLGTPQFDVWFNHVLRPNAKFPLSSAQGDQGVEGPVGPAGKQGVLSYGEQTLLYASLFVNGGVILLVILALAFYFSARKRRDALLHIGSDNRYQAVGN